MVGFFKAIPHIGRDQPIFILMEFQQKPQAGFDGVAVRTEICLYIFIYLFFGVLHAVLFSLALHNADFLLGQAVKLVNQLVDLPFPGAGIGMGILFFGL